MGLIDLIRIIDWLEFYFIPICFVVGFAGNILGSFCLLYTRKLRKRTPFFILAAIGFSDTVFLVSQLQRWLALNFDAQFFLVNNGLCKFYLLLLRFSLIFSASLLFVLVLTRVIRFYMGSYRLSTYSNLGQMCSRLCVGYLFALSISSSWHELWSSGIKIF